MTGMNVNEQLWGDYARFHQLALETQDVDPVYPVLRCIADAENWDTEQRMLAVLAHVTYYDLGSALLTLATGDWPARPMGIERRNLLPHGQLERHIKELESEAAFHGGYARWLSDGLGGDYAANWETVTQRLLHVHGNGRWATYKMCEMLAEIAAFPLEAPDMGHAHSTGPRQGLGLVFPGTQLITGYRPDAVRQLDGISRQLCWRLMREGLPAPTARTETTLCDFHSLVKGHYYVGHDIDQMQYQLRRAGDTPLVHAAYQARAQVLPRAYLGELGGWGGPDRARKAAYRRSGEILTR